MATKRTKAQISRVLYQFYQQPVTKVSIELFLSIGLVAAFAVFAIKPTLETMVRLNNEIEEKAMFNEQLERKITALNTAQSEYQRLEQRSQVLGQAVPVGLDLIRVLKLVEKVASDEMIVIEGFSVPNIPEGVSSTAFQGSVRYMPLNVSLSSDYNTLRAFTNSLLSLRRYFVVRSISVRRDEFRFRGSRDDPSTLQISISLEIPYLL